MFSRVDRLGVAADFDGDEIPSDAGAQPIGATDEEIAPVAMAAGRMRRSGSRRARPRRAAVRPVSHLLALPVPK